jgi:hypothetical protein
MLTLGKDSKMPAPRPLGPISRAALIIFCLLSFAASAHQSVWYFSKGPKFSDLRIFMTGIEVLRSGNGSRLYQFPVQAATQAKLYPQTRLEMLPFNHLAYELLFYWPVSRLPYLPAIITWAALNLALVFLIAMLLKPYTRCLSEVTRLPIALFILAFYPTIYALGEAQDSIIFLLIIALSLRCMDANRVFLAGMLLGFGCFKPHLALLVAFFVFLLGRKWRAIVGCATGGALALGISLAMVGPAMFRDYVSMLRMQEVMAPWGYIFFYMPNLRGLFRWTLRAYLDPGQILQLIFAVSAIVCVVSGWLVVRRRIPRCSISLLYSVAVLTTVLVSYHLHMQDLTMAILPMFVIANLALRSRITNGRFSPVWIAAIALIFSLYSYRLVSVVFPKLLSRGCYLAIPVFLFWIVGLYVFAESRSISDGEIPQSADRDMAFSAVSGA